MRHVSTALLAGLAVGLWGLAAQAGTYTTTTNHTQAEVYNGTTGSGTWQSNIGSAPNDPYVTTGMTITWTGTGAGSVVNIQFDTAFSGIDTRYAPTDVYAADIFISTAGSSTPSGSYNFAVALGFDGPDGGESAGLYKVSGSSNYKTSQAIWGTRTNFSYGGAYRYCPAGNCSGATAEVAPTVLTGGTEDSTSDVVEASNYANGVMDVTLTAEDAAGFTDLMNVFGGSNGFDIFWGTGDCSNAPIWADVPDFSPSPVPEPASLAILASALFGFAMVRRRRVVRA